MIGTSGVGTAHRMRGTRELSWADSAPTTNGTRGTGCVGASHHLSGTRT